MSTAQEIEIKINEMVSKLAPARKYQEEKLRDLVAYGCHFAMAREVGAKRARKLRKRGEEVKFYRNTSNGKARYTWTKRVPPWDVVLVPNAEVRGRSQRSWRLSHLTGGLGR